MTATTKPFDTTPKRGVGQSIPDKVVRQPQPSAVILERFPGPDKRESALRPRADDTRERLDDEVTALEAIEPTDKKNAVPITTVEAPLGVSGHYGDCTGDDLGVA
jgi:hypothetical protein